MPIYIQGIANNRLARIVYRRQLPDCIEMVVAVNADLIFAL